MQNAGPVGPTFRSAGHSSTEARDLWHGLTSPARAVLRATRRRFPARSRARQLRARATSARTDLLRSAPLLSARSDARTGHSPARAAPAASRPARRPRAPTAPSHVLCGCTPREGEGEEDGAGERGAHLLIESERGGAVCRLGARAQAEGVIERARAKGVRDANE